MKKSIKFRRNVYIILLCILVFGIISQLARSELMLKYVSNDSQTSMTQWNEFKQSMTNVSMELDTLEDGDAPAHCLIFDHEDELSQRYYNNLQQVYDYIKQPYIGVDASSESWSFANCQAVVVAASIEVLSSDQVTELEQYIFNGGYAFFARMDQPGPVFSKLYRKLGIVNYRYLVGNDDMNFTSNLLIGQKGALFNDDFLYNDSISVELDHESELLVTGKRSPIIWRYEYGAGAVLVYNGNNLYTKANRGLAVGAISLLIPDYIYPIFNAKLFYIDDYPAPMSGENNPKVTPEYNRNIKTFFKDIWWPDMIELANNYDLKYTAVTIENYNDIVKAPLPTYPQEDLTNLVVFGREVLKTGGEVGIHGYNHQPLQFRQDIADEYSYNVWNSIEDVEASIQEVLSFTEKAFPNYNMVSYVPPSNVLSEEGRTALIENWDTLRVISSLYDEDTKGYSYVQEFEIAEDGIVEMPRIASGYISTAYTTWLEANALTTHGIISHFIHPDDILDEKRTGDKVWSEIYEDFEHMLSRMETTYPWLKPQTSGEAAIHVAHVLNSEITRQHSENELTVDIERFNSNQYFILRSDKKIGRLTNCSVQLIDENTYLVEAKDAHFNIELK